MSEKKKALLKHAEELFYKNGFHAVGVKRIVAESDVALMTFYNHFNSKEDLILEILKKREEKYFSYLNSLLKEKKQAALAIAEAHMKWIRLEGQNGCLFLRVREEFSSDLSNKAVQYANKHKRKLLSFFQEHGFSTKESIRLALLLEGATSLAETTAITEVSEELYYSVNQLFTI